MTVAIETLGAGSVVVFAAIGGYILGNGIGTTNVLIRAIGPSLAPPLPPAKPWPTTAAPCKPNQK